MAGPTLALPAAGRSQPRNTPTYGTLVLIVAGTMLVGGLIAIFQALAFRTHLPPKDVHLDEYLGVVSSLTVILSSATMAWALSALRAGERRQSIAALTATLLFGIAHLSLAWFLLDKAGFGVTSSPFATLFYALVGTGATIVALGLLMIVGCIGKVAGNQLNALEVEGLRAVNWYWQFAVVSWIAVTLTLYSIIKL